MNHRIKEKDYVYSPIFSNKLLLVHTCTDTPDCLYSEFDDNQTVHFNSDGCLFGEEVPSVWLATNEMRVKLEDIFRIELEEAPPHREIKND